MFHWLRMSVLKILHLYGVHMVFILSLYGGYVYNNGLTTGFGFYIFLCWVGFGVGTRLENGC